MSGAFLGEIGAIYESPSIWAAFRRISAMDDRYTDKDVAAIYGELIGKRNASDCEGIGGC